MAVEKGRRNAAQGTGISINVLAETWKCAAESIPTLFLPAQLPGWSGDGAEGFGGVIFRKSHKVWLAIIPVRQKYNGFSRPG